MMHDLSEMIRIQHETALDSTTKEQLREVIKSFDKGYEPALILRHGVCTIVTVKDNYLRGCDEQMIELVRVPLLRYWLIQSGALNEKNDYSEEDLLSYAVNLIDNRVGGDNQICPWNLIELIRQIISYRIGE